MLLHALLVFEQCFTSLAIAVFICYLMLSKNFCIVEMLPTRAAYICVNSVSVLLQTFCGIEDLVTEIAIAVLAGKLM